MNHWFREVVIATVLLSAAVGQSISVAKLVAQAAELKRSTEGVGELHGDARRVATDRYRVFAQLLLQQPAGRDHVSLTRAVDDWLMGCGATDIRLDEREQVLAFYEQRFLQEPGDPAGRARLLHRRTRQAFDRQEGGTVAAQWRDLFYSHPDGPRKVWIAVAAARDLINLCNAPEDAEAILDQALQNLQSMPAWSQQQCQRFCVDRDIWITLPGRDGAASKNDALGHVLLLRGFARIRLGRTLAAIADLEAARSPFELANNEHRCANIGHNLAFARLQLGDYVGALDVAKRTEEAYLRPTWNGDRGPDLNGILAMHLMRARVLLDRANEGDEVAAIALLREIMTGLGSPERNETNGGALFALMEALLRQPATSGRDRELTSLLPKADLLATWGPRAAAERDVLLANFFLQQGRLEHARGAAQNAVRRCRDRNQPRLLVRGLLVLAELERRAQRFDEAMSFYERAADEMRRFILDQQIWRLQGSVPEFLRRFDEILTGSLAVFRETASRGDLRKFYELVQRFHGFESWCWLLHQDRSAESGALANPKTQELRDFKNEHASLLEKSRLLDELRPGEPRGFLRHGKLLRENAAAVKRLDVFIADLQRQLGYSPPASVTQPPSLADVQSSLRDQEILVQCLEVNGEALAFVVTKSEVSLRELPRGDAWRTALDEWQHWTKSGTGELDPTRIRPLVAMSEQLLPPGGWLAKALYNIPSGRLLWSPSGSFCQVPIAALLLRDKPLASEVAVVHVLSSGLMVRNRQRSGSGPHIERPRRLLAFGNPRYPESVVAGLVRRSMTVGGRFPMLSATPKEVLAVARLFASDSERERLAAITAPADFDGELSGERFRVLLGSFAKKSALTSSALSRASVLHFACHGCMDPVAPARSFLALSLPKANDLSETDGLLRLAELSRMRGDFELTVLSACETASGPPRPHASPMSLAWAARLAGARNVLAMGWKLSDQRAAELVVAFYQQWIEEQQAPARALQLVQQAAVGNVPVRDWAALQLWGDAR
jgi:tetratricopeptide (TPR) repeat protein